MSISKELLARRRFLQLSAFVGAGAVIAACGAKAPEAPATEATTAPAAEATMAPEATATVAAVAATVAPTAEPALPAAPAPGPLSAADVGGMDGLVAKAKAEGELNVIALPHDWLNYGEVIASFTQKYGIKVNEISFALTNVNIFYHIYIVIILNGGRCVLF